MKSGKQAKELANAMRKGLSMVNRQTTGALYRSNGITEACALGCAILGAGLVTLQTLKYRCNKYKKIMGCTPNGPISVVGDRDELKVRKKFNMPLDLSGKIVRWNDSDSEDVKTISARIARMRW